MTLQHVTFEVTADQIEPHIGFWSLLGYELIDTPEPLPERPLMRPGRPTCTC